MFFHTSIKKIDRYITKTLNGREIKSYTLPFRYLLRALLNSFTTQKHINNPILIVLRHNKKGILQNSVPIKN